MPTANSIPAGYVWIRDLIPDVQWNQEDQSITLPNGAKLQKHQYTTVGDRSYVNPAALAGLYRPTQQSMTPQTYQQYSGIAESMLKPQYEQRMSSLNRMVQNLTNLIDAKMKAIRASGDQARLNLDTQRRNDILAHRNQSIARGTYASGLGDYSQRRILEAYAPQYQQLESNVNANIASAGAELGGSLSQIGEQAKALESDYMTNLANTAMALYNQDQTQSQNAFDNFIKLISAYNANQTTAETLAIQREKQNIDAAIARAEAIGRVATPEDARILGVDIGTPTDAAYQAAENRKAQLDMFNRELASTEKINQERLRADIANNSAARDNYEFNNAMAIWEATGVAPDNEKLKSYGVQPGTPWSGTLKREVENMKLQMEYDEMVKAREEEAKTEADTAIFKKTFSVDDNTAEAMAHIFSAPNRQAAQALIDENMEDLQAEGVDINALLAKLDIVYPVVEQYLIADYDEFIDPMTLTQDQFKVSQARETIRKFFDKALKAKDYATIERFIKLKDSPQYKGVGGRAILASKLRITDPNETFIQGPIKK